MLSARALTKRYGGTVAVDALTFDVEPGQVTGFLGPNGAGKSTTLRMLLGLDRPSSGSALVHGRPYRELDWPGLRVGALLDHEAHHPRRSAHSHLLAAARTSGLPVRRVGEVLETVGLAEVAHRRVGAYSLGMRQRLGIAEALLGDPGILILDEPVNGLDVDGVRWVRELMRDLAREGRTVLVSSHLMSEMQVLADRLLILGAGRLIADSPMREVIESWSRSHVVVHTPDAEALAAHLLRVQTQERPVTVERAGDGELRVFGPAPHEVGDAAHAAGVRVHGLHRHEATLEQAYVEMTQDAVEYATPADAHAAQEAS